MLDSEWFKTDHRAVLVVLSLKATMRYTMTSDVSLRGWKPDDPWERAAAEMLTDWRWDVMAPLLKENSKSTQKTGNQGDDCDRARAQISLVEDEERRAALRASRVELALSTNLEQDQGEYRDGKLPRKHKVSISTGVRLRNKKIPKQFSQTSSKTSIQSRRTKKLSPNPKPIRETSLGRVVEKLDNGLCRRNADFAKETGKSLEEVEKRRRLIGSDYSRCSESIAPGMSGKLARSLSRMCWEMTFPEDWLCFLTVMAPKVVGATCLTKFRPIAGLCAMRKVLGYVWLKSLRPLTHADAGLVLLLQAADLSREWKREIVVVQLDVKKAFDHVDHRAAVKAMKLQGVSLFSMALIAAIWNGSCMKVRLGTVSSNKVRMNRGLLQGAPESPVITMIMELVLRDLIKSCIARKLAWRLDDFVLAAICYADDLVLVAASVAAAEVMVAEIIAKLKEVGLTVGAQNTHWASFPKMTDKNIMVDGLAVLWEEVLEFVGSKVCLDGNVRYAIAHITAQANKYLTNWRPVLRSSWLPRLLRLNVV